MLTAAEAKSLGGIARQVRALLTGIDKLPDAFEAIEGAEVQLATVKKEQLRVEADVAATRATFAKLDADMQRLQVRYAQLDQEYHAKQQALEARLSTTRAELTAAQALKRETEEQLATITAKWHLKTGQAAAH